MDAVIAWPLLHRPPYASNLRTSVEGRSGGAGMKFSTSL
jgi:hypothetical protein